MTVKTVVALGLWLAVSQVCWAQDPLNDVHVEPPPPAPTAPVTPADAKAPGEYPTPARGQEGAERPAQ